VVPSQFTMLVSLSWSGCEAAMVVLRAAVQRFGWSRGTAGKRGGRRRLFVISDFCRDPSVKRVSTVLDLCFILM